MGGVAPDVYTYSSVVTAYARLGDVENAVKVLSDMAKSGVKPNRFTLSSVMQVCCAIPREQKSSCQVCGQAGVESGRRCLWRMLQVKVRGWLRRLSSAQAAPHDQRLC